MYYRADDPYYGSFSVLFMIGPTILAILALLIEFYTTKKSESCQRKFGRFLKCLLHLKFIQLIKMYIYYKKLRKVAKHKEKTSNFVNRLKNWIDDCGSLRLDDEWTWAKIKQNFR